MNLRDFKKDPTYLKELNDDDLFDRFNLKINNEMEWNIEDLKEINDKDILEEFSCKICYEFSSDLKICKNCNFVICSECFININQSTNKICPICQKNINEYISICKNLKNILNKIKVYCIFKNKGCDFKMKYEELDIHLNNNCLYMIKFDKNIDIKLNENILIKNIDKFMNYNSILFENQKTIFKVVNDKISISIPKIDNNFKNELIYKMDRNVNRNKPNNKEIIFLGNSKKNYYKANWFNDSINSSKKNYLNDNIFRDNNNYNEENETDVNEYNGNFNTNYGIKSKFGDFTQNNNNRLSNKYNSNGFGFGFGNVNRSNSLSRINIENRFNNFGNNSNNPLFSWNLNDNFNSFGSNKKNIEENCKTNLYNGYKEILFDTDKYYNGYFENGEFNGKGYYKNKNIILEGNFKNGKLDGFGIKFLSKIHCFTGEFFSNKIYGYGIEKNNKMIYKGKFLGDKKDGFGRLDDFENNEIFYGNWFNGKKHGYGIYFNNNNKTFYEGYWKNDKKDGKGIELLEDGIYLGNYNNGKIDSSCKYLFFNGDYSIGEFKDDKFLGYKTYWDEKKNKVKTKFLNDFENEKIKVKKLKKEKRTLLN